MAATSTWGEVIVIFQQLPLISRILGTETPDMEAVGATSTEQIGNTAILIRDAGVALQAVASCHGLIVNIDGVAPGSATPAPALELIKLVLTELGCS